MTDLEILRKKRTQVLLVWKTRLVIESYYFKLMCYTFDRCPHVLEEFLSNTRFNFLYFLVELWVQFLLSGSSPVWTLFTTVQLIPFDISPHCSILLYSLIERCCAPAYKGGTKGDTTKLSIFFHRHHSISISESR